MEQITAILLVLSAVLFLLLVFAALRLRSANRSSKTTITDARNIRKTAPYGLLTVNRSTGAILAANPAAAELFGRKPSELEGRSLEDFLTPTAGEENETSSVPGIPDGLTRFIRGDGFVTHLAVSPFANPEASQPAGTSTEEVDLMLVSQDARVAAEAALEDLEERYRAVISHAPALVYTIDLATGESSCDGDGTGFGTGDSGWLAALPGTPELPVHPEDASRLETLRAALGRPVVEEGASQGEQEEQDEAADPETTIEYRVLLEDRRELRLREEAWATPGGAEGPSFIRGVILDATRLRGLEDELDEALGINRAMMGVSGGGVAVRSAGRLFAVNPGGAEILGSTSEGLSGRAYLDFVHPDSERAARAGVRRTDRGDTEPKSRMVWLRDSGREVEVEVFAAPVRYAGDETAALLFFEDVTASERAKRKEVLLLEDLERRNARLEQFVLSTARNLASTLDDLDAATTRALDHPEDHDLRVASEKLSRMAEELSLLASLPDVSEGTSEPEEVDLSEIARAVSNRLEGGDATGRPPARERSVEMIVAGGLIVVGERKTLTRAMTGLVENAWRAAGRSPRPRIVVGRVERAEEPVFFVRDNGPGFDMAYAGSLFDPLRNEPPENGYGEGLSAASRIIERHCGQLWAESEPGKGATFYFTLQRP
ncbi:MAG: sensor histidine kinase [Rubrobacter sp.]